MATDRGECVHAPHAPPTQKSTPLGWACRWGRVALVELLLARGADPIEAGAEPWATPLAWAERRHHAGIASILRQRGAGR